jgi:hypothetical protein
MCGHVVLLNSYCNFQETAQKNSRPIGLNSPNFVTLLEVRLGIGAIAFPVPNASHFEKSCNFLPAVLTRRFDFKSLGRFCNLSVLILSGLSNDSYINVDVLNMNGTEIWAWGVISNKKIVLDEKTVIRQRSQSPLSHARRCRSFRLTGWWTSIPVRGPWRRRGTRCR